MFNTSASLCRSWPGCFLANILMTSGVLKALLMAAWMACQQEKTKSTSIIRVYTWYEFLRALQIFCKYYQY